MHGKQAEVAALQAQAELTAKSVASATSERDSLQRMHGPHDALVHEARAMAESKHHIIQVQARSHVGGGCCEGGGCYEASRCSCGVACMGSTLRWCANSCDGRVQAPHHPGAATGSATDVAEAAEACLCQ